jgi:acyl carrier protein
MNDLRATVVGALVDAAPDIDPADLAPDADFREDLEIDSMDFLEFVSQLAKRTGVEVPERDYARLSSVNTSVAYLEQVEAAAR